MKLYYLSSNSLARFRENLDKNVEDYRNGKLRFVQANDLIREPKILFEDLELDMSQPKSSDSDYENIKRFYLALKDLTDSQATEEMLWAGLCHYSPFWEYLKYRWNCQTEKEILTRYFFDEGGRSIIYNGLARLWWYGRMTYDEEAEDPFELTKYICESNLTLKGILPLTFTFSNNKRVYRTYLRALMNFEKKHELNQENHEKVRRQMAFWGGKVLLDSLSEQELIKMIEEYLNKITSEKI